MQFHESTIMLLTNARLTDGRQITQNAAGMPKHRTTTLNQPVPGSSPGRLTTYFRPLIEIQNAGWLLWQGRSFTLTESLTTQLLSGSRETPIGRGASHTQLNLRRDAVASHPLWIDSNSEANPSDT